MWKAMVYKEWLKTRWLIIGLWILGAVLLAYIFISLGRVYRIMGMSEVWDVIVNQHQGLYYELEYYPVVFGVLMALAQFIPEVLKKRLKLTLHLPMSQKKAYFSMQLYGTIIILLSFSVQLILLYMYSRIYFPIEIVLKTFLTIIPWYGAGLTAYILATMICIEPVWKRRILYVFMTLAVLYIFYLSEYPGAYEKVWWFVLLIPIYVFSFPWLSVHRFKIGVQ